MTLPDSHMDTIYGLEISIMKLWDYSTKWLLCKHNNLSMSVSLNNPYPFSLPT